MQIVYISIIVLVVLVYGWLNDTYIGEEKFQEHVLMTGFRKGANSINEQIQVTFDVISIENQGSKGNAVKFRYSHNNIVKNY